MKTPKGLTNKIIIDGDILTKISNPKVDYFLNRENETNLYKYFTTLKNKKSFLINPLAWGYDENNNFYVQFKYISDAYTFEDNPDFNRDNLLLVKETIDQFHELKPENIITFDPQKYLDKFKTKIKEPFYNLQEFDFQLKKIIEHYYDSKKICFSHNDLTRGNFLFTNNQLKIIDYEYSYYNHYLFDYASFITESLNGLHEEDFFILLNLNKTEVEELNGLILYQSILWINWCNYMFENFHNEIYKTIADQKYLYLKNFWNKKQI